MVATTIVWVRPDVAQVVDAELAVEVFVHGILT
jgi:hypothetical protein